MSLPTTKRVDEDLDYTVRHYSRYRTIHRDGIKKVLEGMSKQMKYIVRDMRAVRGFPSRTIQLQSGVLLSRHYVANNNEMLWDEMRLFMDHDAN